MFLCFSEMLSHDELLHKGWLRCIVVRLRHNPTNMRATSASICFIRNLYIIVIAQYDICNINLPSVQSLRKLLHTVYNAKKKSWGQNFKRLWTAVDMSVI